MAGRARRRSPARLARIEGAKAAPYPGFVEPCLATLRLRPPAGARWIHEIKFDGYRTQVHLRDGVPTIYTRRGHDWTHRFRVIREAAEGLKAESLIIDTEIIIPAKGGGDFGAMQDALGKGRSRDFICHAFDLLYLNGFDLRGAPLIARKRLLADVLERSDAGERIQFVEHLEADGADVYASACRMELEGLVSKLRDAPYRSGRGETWIKAKCSRRGKFVVIGFDPSGPSLGALRLGREEGGKLVYTGKVGTGFSAKTALEMRKKLQPLLRKTPPVSHSLREPKARWVEPRFEADVEYLEISNDGLLRHPSFRRLARRAKMPRR